jgi:meso-butanediol dehydrogenase / (S,S)-butanediol dehydrogenase / diacetyl reductase
VFPREHFCSLSPLFAIIPSPPVLGVDEKQVPHEAFGLVRNDKLYERESMKGLKEKRVLITGGASGIGAATAARFLEEGSHVCVLDRDAQACAQIKRELPALSGAIIADVTDLMQVEAAFAEAIRLMGDDGVDVLINNAGISIRHKFLDITPEEWDKVIAVNLTGVFYVAQIAARHMVERFSKSGAGVGVILQTASTNGVMGYPYYADYNATKAGVIELTRSMALELAPRVRVCAVAPGYVLTPMQRAEYSDAMLDEVNRKIPLGRHAKPEEIAALFAYLASDDAAYATGHVFTMDGGETAGGLASR